MEWLDFLSPPSGYIKKEKIFFFVLIMFIGYHHLVEEPLNLEIWDILGKIGEFLKIGSTMYGAYNKHNIDNMGIQL